MYNESETMLDDDWYDPIDDTNDDAAKVASS